MQILCATDLSPSAKAAGDVATALAVKLGLPLRLIYCIPNSLAMTDAIVDVPDAGSAREELAAEAERLRLTGAKVIFEIYKGSPSHEVPRAAAEHSTKMLVVGEPEAIFPEPSVAAAAARLAPVPTLVVRHATPLLKWLRESVPLHALCAVDFTVTADAAVASLRELCRLGPVAPTAAYISSGLTEMGAADETKQRVQRDVWDRLHLLLGATQELADTPFKIHVRPAVKRPADDFLDLAGEEGADLVIVGTHQFGGLRRLMKGSFSQSVVKRAATNVLCVPAAHYVPPVHLPAVHRVLVPTDFSDRGNAAVLHALGLVKAGDAVRLLHVQVLPKPAVDVYLGLASVISSEPLNEETKQEIEAKLKALIPPTLASGDVDISFEALAAEEVAGAIREAASRFGADLICMGTTGHSRARIALLGSTVQAVLARAHIPVLAVPPLV